MECYKQYQDVERKRQDAEFNEQLNAQGIIDGAKLKVNIVDARYLDPTDSTFIRVEQDGAEGRTKSKQGSGPIWNEAIVFDVNNINQPLIVQLVSEKTNSAIFEELINFKDIMEQP